MKSAIDVNPVIDAMARRRVPPSVTLAGLFMIVIGVVGMVYGLIRSPAWAWGAFLTALVYTLALGQGGVLFSVMMTLTWGRWGRPLKRIGEAFGFFLPVGYLLLLVFLVVGNGLYPWHDGTFLETGVVDLAPHSEQAIATKAIWLSLPFFIGRQVVGLGLLFVLDFLYIRAALRPDLLMAGARLRRQHPAWQPPAWWALMGAGSGDLQSTVESSHRTQSFLAPMIALLYAGVFSMVAFDMIMSLWPWWYSNMFGGWFFVSSFWVALAALGITGLLTRDWLGITKFVTPHVTHDLGKLVLALCMFWAYTFFAQLLPIWYANMGEETIYLLVRLKYPVWAWLARTVGVLCFLAPFTILVSRGIKKMKWPFIGVLGIVMLGVFLERTLLVMPSVYFGRTFPIDLFLITSFGVLAGFLGLFMLVVTRVLASVPPLVVSDPHLEPHPWDVHVHPVHEAHG